ncbi:hypothetical protein MPL1_12341 [Methylophaga lonarensis MPL]|uniref:Nephrocystin 3-like N-terminal domain-containing protein n=1 Tax=Methylophaga lonarensis MPL TaxID=1286106 RepID=M7PDS4_9GAMM|nr:ATP-binding protein [Methylophaga lonarensis]EMR12055.1 hypothetical protein MPL1_12341 [Methylophaga lonarensis MPL]
MKVKNAAITYTAYDYQTLQGVKLIAEWLCSPTKYSRVAFEADEDANDTPAGIDDIVGERPDGIKDFWQVKFSPSPHKDENRLSWDWLLSVSGKTKRSRSILRKLYDAIVSVPTENLGDVVLLTNKLPDKDIEGCLSGSKILFEKIDNITKSLIANQLGSDKEAEYLFSRLAVQHSDGDYHVTKRSVQAGLLHFSDDAGVERLISRSREWAMFKDNPPGGGWIHLHHIREILSPRRPEPIPEIFFVPDDYCLPDVDFHSSMIERIGASRGEVITLTGKPGGGKSTYISFLCQELERTEIPFVRHHYFLSLGDSTADRVSPRIVAESLLHQISSIHKDAGANTNQPENLSEAIRTCANYYSDKGKPFVVLIDGLDHVWRDNAKDKKPLDEIFKQLLPVVDNLVILIGTQPVDDNLLPNILLSNSPKQNWYWLPEMSGNSIYEFLKLCVESGRLYLNCHESHRNEEIQNGANALLQITNGYPLHVIYSTEYISSHGLALSQWNIERLPPCTDGNIANYYNELWNSLNYRQKDVLHLSCGFKFAWPRQAISQVVNDEHDKAPSVDAVSHLLSETISGIRPFHESLVVFVTSLVDHKERIKALLPDVCVWLQAEAPTHLKDQWLWSCQAMSGNTIELRQGIKRDWVLDKVVLGMPVDACIRLLSEAETYAFDDCSYAEAYRHRHLKTRLINGPEFQTWDSTLLETLSIVGADAHAINEILSRENEYSPLKLSILSIVMWFRGEINRAAELSRKAIDRYRAKTKLLASRNSQNEEVEAITIVKAGTLTDSLNYDAIFDNGNFDNWPDGYIASLRSACLIKKDINLLIRAWKCLPVGSPHIEKIELDAIRLSILEDADICCWPEFKSFSSHGVSGFFRAYSKITPSDIQAETLDDENQSAYRVTTSQSYHTWFFSSLQLRIVAEGDFSWLPVRAESERVDVSDHYDLLNMLADIIVVEILAGSVLTFDLVCSLFPDNSNIEDAHWEKRRADISFKREWIEIAADCHLLTTRRKISSDEFDNVLNFGIFRSSWLRLWYKELKLELLSDGAAKQLIDQEILRLESELEETIEKSNGYLELAEIAFQHDIQEHFKKCLRTTWDFVLGYGHHKDPTIFDVLNAIEYLSKSDPKSSLQMLERISPIVFNISKFTDGDETRHSKHSISSLVAKLNPQTAASIYDQELRDGEWYYAEETIQRLIEQSDLSALITKQLFLTGLPTSCHETIRKKRDLGDANATDIASNIKNHLGIDVLDQHDENTKKPDEFDEKITLNPADYPPESFEQLADDLRGKISTGKFWKRWYQFWLDQDKESDLIQHLMPHVLSFTERYDDKRYLLDLLFRSQRNISGKSKAFDLLALAHSAMNGWSNWFESSEKSIERLGIVATQYANKIDEFIRLTSAQPDTWKDKFGSLIIPNDKLVFLLSQAGRIDEAIQLTIAMVEELEDSVRNLNLPKPDWDWETSDSLDEALSKLLISRLKCPIPSIKLWTIEQISLLLSSQKTKIESLLVQDLASRKQESECVEVLCVFYVAQSKGYKCHQDLGRHIKARSTLSDLLIKSLIPGSSDFGEYAYPFTPHICLGPDNHRFSYFQGNHVPRLYFSWLQKEERRTGIPFTKYYELEWCNTFEYLSPAETQIDFFLGSDRQRSTGQFYTQASHRGRSAYLRTIEIAKQFYGMPDTYAEHLSILALPIEPAYTGIKPYKPSWLPKWDSNWNTDENGIAQFVKLAIGNFDSINGSQCLLAFSLPIKIDENTWIDVAVAKASVTEQSAEGFELEERSGCISIGNLLDPELAYEFQDDDQIPAGVMAVTPYPFNRYGHWHSDMETRCLYVPKSNLKDKRIVGKTVDGAFCYYLDGTNIGFSQFWHSGWQPIHPKGIRSLCGSSTVIYNERLVDWYSANDSSASFSYVCKAKVLSSTDSYRDFNEHELNFVIT